MKYSPLAIHCTSLCFDVIQNRDFKMLTHDDIEGFRSDIYALILCRAHLVPFRHEREDKFAAYVTDGVLQVLHQCLNGLKFGYSVNEIYVSQMNICVIGNLTDQYIKKKRKVPDFIVIVLVFLVSIKL